MKRILLSLLLLQSAGAGDLTGLIEAGYSQSTIAGSDYRSVGGGGSLMRSFGEFSLQADATAASYSAEGQSVLSWSLGGDVMWRRNDAVLGFSGAYATRDNARSFITRTASTFYTLDYEGYQIGAFGEWYARPDLTLRARGGGLVFSCSGAYPAACFEPSNGKHYFDVSGGYGGIGAEYYPAPDLGLSGQFDYLSANRDYLGARRDVVRVGAAAEYQMSALMPLSIVAGYEYADGDLRGRGAANSLTLRLRYRFGSAGTLVERDRSGPATWNGLYVSATSTGRPLRPTEYRTVVCSLPDGRPC